MSKTKTARVFIDGEAGTTGLGIRERLAHEVGFTVVSIDQAKRKDPAARQALMADVDVVILCLPDDSAKESSALAAELGSKAPRLIDASTAHRVAPGWAYGFPELTKGHADIIAKAQNVSNPGCYPTGGIALLRPLIEAGLMPASQAVTVNAVSGYSGGGKSMIEAYEIRDAPEFELYGLSLTHKHLAELQHYSGLTTRPIFVPSVGNFKQGMLVSVPLHLETFPGKPRLADLEAALAAHYAGCEWIKVLPSPDNGKVDALALNDSNAMELFVFGNDTLRQAVLVARLDNLGKGASGAAVQNLKLMMGENWL